MHTFNSPLIVLSAASGAGKTTIANILAHKYPELEISISATTRGIRPREIDGKDYHFLSIDEFQKHIRDNNFLEYEEVHGDYYGTLKDRVDEMLSRRKTVIFDIDVKGALSIKRIYPQSILIFIKTPSLSELKRRLKNRKSESEDAIQKRLSRIDFEYEQADKFDHIIINDKLEHAVEQIENLVLQRS